MIIWPKVPFDMGDAPAPTFIEPEDTLAGCQERANALTARAVMLIAGEDAERHLPASATGQQLAVLPALRTNNVNRGVLRYCPMCWTVFLPDGPAFR